MNDSKGKFRVGVDIGGTFTDIFLTPHVAGWRVTAANDDRWVRAMANSQEMAVRWSLVRFQHGPPIKPISYINQRSALAENLTSVSPPGAKSDRRDFSVGT